MLSVFPGRVLSALEKFSGLLQAVFVGFCWVLFGLCFFYIGP